MAIRVKNWTKFQHFSNRRPPWVKLYRDLLDDMEWHRLDPKAAKALVTFWLIASENNGDLPDVETLAFRLRKTSSEIEDIVSKLSHWLDRRDIDVISTRYQDDATGDITRDITVIPIARSREREEETEREREKAPRSRAATPSIEGVPEALLADYLAVRKAKKAGPLTDTAIAGLQREAAKAGISLCQAITACVEFSWQGFNAGWYAERTKGQAVTVPSAPGRDPALQKLDEDARVTKPPTLEVLAKLAAIRQGAH